MLVFLDFIHSSVNFEPLIVGIRHVLLEIRQFNMDLKTDILTNFELLEYQIFQQTVHKITTFHSHFQLKSKQKGKTGYF